MKQVRRALLNIFIRNQDDHTKSCLLDSSGVEPLARIRCRLPTILTGTGPTNTRCLWPERLTFELDDLLAFGKFVT